MTPTSYEVYNMPSTNDQTAADTAALEAGQTGSPDPASIPAEETAQEEGADHSSSENGAVTETAEQAEPVTPIDAPKDTAEEEESPQAANESQAATAPEPAPENQAQNTTTEVKSPETPSPADTSSADQNDGSFLCGTKFTDEKKPVDPVIAITADSLDRYIELMNRPVVNDAAVKSGITIIAYIVDRILRKPSEDQMVQIRDFIVKHKDDAMHPRNALRGINLLDRNTGSKVQCFMDLMMAAATGSARRVSTPNAHKILGSFQVLQWIKENSQLVFVDD